MNEIKRKISDLISDSPGLLLPILMPLFLIFIMSALFFMPLYGIISGRIYKECFFTPEDYKKLSNKLWFVTVITICFYLVYEGTIGIGTEICKTFDWTTSCKYIIGCILFWIYLLIAMHFNNSAIKRESEKDERKTEYINISN